MVDDEFRKRGIGTELMEQFEIIATKLHTRKLGLFVEETKKNARNLYVKRGFAVEEGNNVGSLIKMAKYL